MPRQGWKKLPGTSERYIAPTGETVSRRQYDNLRAQEHGYGSRSEYERRYDDSTYLWAWRQMQRSYLYKGVTVQRARALDRMGGEFNKKLRAAQATGWGRTPAGRDPRGPMSSLLIEMGLRDPSATYAVGETDGPTGRSR